MARKTARSHVNAIRSIELRGVSYTNSDHKQFLLDMKEAGLLDKTSMYRGRGWYMGPATRCDNIQQVLSETRIECKWDNMGLGYIVYPYESDLNLENVSEDSDKAHNISIDEIYKRKRDDETDNDANDSSSSESHTEESEDNDSDTSDEETGDHDD